MLFATMEIADSLNKILPQSKTANQFIPSTQ